MENKEDYAVNEPNKIYIVGGKGVGKTSLFDLIFNKQFDENIEPSQPGIGCSIFEKNNKSFTIKDLTDDDNFTFTKVFKDELEDVLLVFVMFSLSDADSFEQAKNLIVFINNHLLNNKEMNIILLGNKVDLRETNEEAIVVKKEEIDNYINSLENSYYYEISCKSGYNVDKVKKMVEDIELNDNNEDDDDKLPEEERKQKVKGVNEKSSCLIF